MTLANQRKAYGQTLVALGHERDDIVVCDADLGKSTMSALFEEAFPERHFEMGIGEANMASFAAGLALSGRVAFINSFAVFSAGRAYDQIRQSIAIAGLNVNVCGSSSGLSDYSDGATHQAVEDMAIMRAIPHMTVVTPADANQTRAMTRAVADHQGPVYFRLCRNDLPDIYSPSRAFTIGQPDLLRDGSDVVLFACGAMVHTALAAAERLSARGISVRVVNAATLKPLHERAIHEIADGVELVATVEEHSLIGGLASAITYTLRGGGVPVETIGIDDEFGQSARDYEQLLSCYGLSEQSIVDRLEQAWDSRRSFADRKVPAWTELAS
jgi:transketolase